MAQRTCSDKGLAMIEGFEGFRAEQYRDAVGVPTVGYGTTSAVVSPLPATVTQAEAQQLLQKALERDVYPAIWRQKRRHSQSEFDAIASTIYNLGSGVLAPGRSLGDAYASADWKAAVPAAMLQYVYAGGRPLPGLVQRRQAERLLWLTGKYPAA